MSNYRIRMLPGRLMPFIAATGPDDLSVWIYEPTGKRYVIPNNMAAKEIARRVNEDLTREWERLTNE